MTAKFTCNIPRVAMATGGARPSLYGHGLFGSRDEVNQGQLQDMAQEHDFVFCATDWVGMACTDLPPTDPQSAPALFTDFVLTGSAAALARLRRAHARSPTRPTFPTSPRSWTESTRRS